MAEAASALASESTLSGLMKWTGGIIASVITAVSIYYLTRPMPAPAPEQSAAFYGVVADANSRTPIPNATVAIALGQNSASQHTDNLGQYNVVLESTGSNAVMGNLNVSADGYKPYSNTVALQPGNNFAEITLQSTAPTPGAASPPAQQQPGTAASGASGVAIAPSQSIRARAAITFQKPPPNFVRRQGEVILRAKQ
jgi:hypothetical protein